MAEAATTAPPVTAMRGDCWRMVARGLGQLLITLGVVILLFVVYELCGTNFYTQGQQNQLEDSIHHGWTGAAPDITQVNVKNVPLGSGIAVLRIPRFDKGYHMVIVEGTGYEDLKKGP